MVWNKIIRFFGWREDDKVKNDKEYNQKPKEKSTIKIESNLDTFKRNKLNVENIFEVHITINPLTNTEIEAFVTFTKLINVKPILIELDTDENQQQPMISKTFKANVQNEINTLVNLFKKSNYEIKRIKVEVPIGMEEKGEKAFPNYHGQYYEWHGKIDKNKISVIKDKPWNYANLHVSKNALKGENDKRFITFRSYDNRSYYLNTIKYLKIDLKEDNIRLYKEESEYCVYDSNKSLDKDWIDTPEITDYNYLNILMYEALLRRASVYNEHFILKGSLLTRQYISKNVVRNVIDIDFFYTNEIEDQADATKIFSNWLTRVTETYFNDGIQFRSFRENEFWRGIDYAMNDDFPTTNTDLECTIDGDGPYEISVDISWNLPLNEKPVSIVYKPLRGNSFTVPDTIPLSIQISWKLHQSVVRPRAKDLIDIILLLENNPLCNTELKAIARNYYKECIKDKFDPLRILVFCNDELYNFCCENEEKIMESFSTYNGFKCPFGFEITNNLEPNYIDRVYKKGIKDYTHIHELILDFQEILIKFNIDKAIIEYSKN